MDDVVLCEVGDDGVALLTLNRPDRLNAWTYECRSRCSTCSPVRRGRARAGDRDHRRRPRVVPGADMSDLSALSGNGGAVDATASRTDTRPITFAMSIPKPVIAAINGACAGLGLAFALTCDVRFCRTRSRPPRSRGGG